MVWAWVKLGSAAGRTKAASHTQKKIRIPRGLKAEPIIVFPPPASLLPARPEGPPFVPGGGIRAEKQSVSLFAHSKSKRLPVKNKNAHWQRGSRTTGEKAKEP